MTVNHVPRWFDPSYPSMVFKNDKRDESSSRVPESDKKATRRLAKQILAKQRGTLLGVGLTDWNKIDDENMSE